MYIVIESSNPVKKGRDRMLEFLPLFRQKEWQGELIKDAYARYGSGRNTKGSEGAVLLADVLGECEDAIILR